MRFTEADIVEQMILEGSRDPARQRGGFCGYTQSYFNGLGRFVPR